ncbi:MAG TPA: DUF3107 family protein [Acidimicrobiia bacterium]|nr:DUF3107 family protein [Acidimicrobiia bacterium]
MSETTSIRVKFGLMNAARDLDLEVEDVDVLLEDLASALAGDQKLLWVTEKGGHRYGLAVDKIVYVDVEPEEAKKGIGFSA